MSISPISDEFVIATGQQFQPPQSQRSSVIEPSGDLLTVWADVGAIRAQRFLKGDNQPGPIIDLLQRSNGARLGNPSVAVNADGTMVLVWEEADPPQIVTVLDPANPSPPVPTIPWRYPPWHQVYGQRFDANGLAIGQTFAISTTEPYQAEPQIAADASGNFVVVWTQGGPGGRLPGVIDDEGHADLFARRFDATGTALGDVFQIDSTDVGNQAFASLAMSPSGDFVVAFTSETSFFDRDILVRRFNSSGQPLGNDQLVNVTTVGYQDRASVAIRPDGHFVVSWDSKRDLGDEGAVYVRLFDANGTVLSSELEVSDPCLGYVFMSAVGMAPDGRFAIVWSAENGRSMYEVFVRSYLPTGIPETSAARFNATAEGWQMHPKMAMGATGEGVILWKDFVMGESERLIGRAFSFDGVATSTGAHLPANARTLVENGLFIGPRTLLDSQPEIQAQIPGGLAGQLDLDESSIPIISFGEILSPPAEHLILHGMNEPTPLDSAPRAQQRFDLRQSAVESVFADYDLPERDVAELELL